jgi:hypothetical protein
MLQRIRLLARPELIDGVRNRRQLVIRALTPLVLLVALVLLAALTGGAETRAEDTYRIAVEGPLDELAGVGDAVAAYDGGRLVLEPVDDAVLAVAEGDDAGLVVVATQPPAVEVVSDVTSNQSRAAASLLRASLYEDAPYDPSATDPGVLSVDIADVGRIERTSSGKEQREGLGRAAAGLVLIQGSVLVGTAAARVHGRRSTGALTPQLLLPLRRVDLVLGQGTAETGLGLITCLPVLGLLAFVVAVGLVAADSAATVVPALVVMGLATVAVAVPLVAAGLAIGIWARSSQQVAALTAGSFVIVAILARPVAITSGDPSAFLSALPLVGPALLVRQTIDGSFDPLAAVLAVLGTTLLTYVLVRLAARFLGREIVALRSS